MAEPTWENTKPAESKSGTPSFEATQPRNEAKFDLKGNQVELKNVNFNPSKNSWLYDFVTGAQGKNAIEPTTAAEIMAPSVMGGFAGTGGLATELGEGAIATERAASPALEAMKRYSTKAAKLGATYLVGKKLFGGGR